MATNASALYAKNLLNFVQLVINNDKKEIVLDTEDEIIAGVLMTKDGKVVHPNFATEKAEAAPKKAAAKKPAAKKAPAKKTAEAKEE